MSTSVQFSAVCEKYPFLAQKLSQAGVCPEDMDLLLPHEKFRNKIKNILTFAHSIDPDPEKIVSHATKSIHNEIARYKEKLQKKSSFEPVENFEQIEEQLLTLGFKKKDP